ncbi:MAG TPA: hypothetical protein VM695_09945 [Phycisphaerae bacterium]|nr:hypothetical protein [Phycisphaerae bacterium]
MPLFDTQTVPNPQVDPIEVMVPEIAGRGKRFFVHSGIGSASSDGKLAQYPLLTVAAALAKCVPNRGDRVVCLPGHAETINAVTLLALDVAGVTVEGLGEGSLRPTLTFSTSTAAILTVSAANVTLKNFILANNIDSQVIMVDVNADDFTIEDCEFPEASAKQPLVFIDVNGGGANAADRCKIRRCKITAVASGVCNAAIEIGAVQDGVEIVDNVIQGDFDDAGIHSASILTNLVVKDNIVSNLQTGQHAIELSGAATGFLVDNRLYGDTLGTILDPGSMKCLGNLEVDAIDQAGVGTPATTAGPLPAGSIAATTFAADAISADAVSAAAVAKIAAGLEPFWVKKTLVSSAILTTGVDVTGVSSGGALTIEDVILQTNATGLATGTNVIFYTNNANGDGGTTGFLQEAVANLGANDTVELAAASVNHQHAVLESGKKISVKATGAHCDGAGTIDVYIKFSRHVAAATIAAA